MIKIGDLEINWHKQLPIYVCILLSGFSITWAAAPPANNAPVATGQSVATDEDTATSSTLAGIDADEDNLTYGEIYPKANLSSADLSGADISNANLSGVNLSSVNLTDTQASFSTTFDGQHDRT